MKILYVNDFLVYAGAEKLVSRLIQQANKHHHQTKYITAFLNREAKLSKQNFMQIMTTWKPDLVHFHNITTVGIEPIEYCVKEGIPVVWTVHDWYPVCRVRTRLTSNRQICNPHDWSDCVQCSVEVMPMLRDLGKLREATRDVEIVTICNAQRLLMHDFDYDINHITVIKNGVDTDAYKPEDDKGYIFCHGVMRYEKALEWHFHSAETLPHKHVFAGEILGGFAPSKIKTAMLGFLPEYLLVSYLANCSLVQVPARWHEPCGLTILEAFACGKPVVSVNLGGIPEYVEDGKTGFLTDPEDVTGFLDLTHYLMENPDLRHEMGMNALEKSKYYSLNRMWNEYETLYKKTMR